jgi:hypothetical protein
MIDHLFLLDSSALLPEQESAMRTRVISKGPAARAADNSMIVSGHGPGRQRLAETERSARGTKSIVSAGNGSRVLPPYDHQQLPRPPTWVLLPCRQQ